MNLDITQMTVEQLKALAYDQLATIENAQNNLKVVNEEIVKKQSQPQEVKTAEVSEK